VRLARRTALTAAAGQKRSPSSAMPNFSFVALTSATAIPMTPKKPITVSTPSSTSSASRT
jgi:hypothetical protein